MHCTPGKEKEKKNAVSFFILHLVQLFCKPHALSPSPTPRQQTQRQEALSRIGADLFAIALDAPFRFPATFVFVLRAFSTLEGIGKALDPEFKFFTVATPYAQELLDLQDASTRNAFILETLQQTAQDSVDAATQAPQRIARAEKILSQLESGELKLRTRVLEAERAARRQGILQVRGEGRDRRRRGAFCFSTPTSWYHWGDFLLSFIPS
jgi:predicted unusual protein kinase regulating ubiquinone biosynthesis (AarF/ABC1/UbiB family)